MSLESRTKNGLFYISHNPEGEETIVLLHGLISSSLEYEQVLPHIPSRYHVLVPDLPGHSKSKDVPLTTWPNLITVVSDLVKTHARNGKAHLVGLSFGGYIALTLAAEQPGIVQSCWATGSSHPTDTWVMGNVAYAFPIMKLLMMIPGFARWTSPFPIPPKLQEEVTKNMSYELASAGYGVLHNEYRRQDSTVRTLVCSGSRQDNIQHMRDYLEDVKKDPRPGSIPPAAYVAKGMVHAWSAQAPEVYAKAVVAWIEGRELPQEMIKLEEWKE